MLKIKNKHEVKGISFPEFIWKIIDEERKDVTRSKFLLRIVEKSYGSSFDKLWKTDIK